jgi:hypothetical protein
MKNGSRNIGLLAFFLSALAIAQPPVQRMVNLPNASSTGTTINKLAKLAAPGMTNLSTAVVTGAGDTVGALGIVIAGAGTTGQATIQEGGEALCVFDNATTAGDYVQISGTVAGDCHDSGASFPTSGGQVIGRVLETFVAPDTILVDMALRQSSLGAAAGVTSVNTLTGAVTLFTVNAQTGTYQVLAGDFAACKTISVASGTFTITLVASGSQPPSGQCIDVINYGSGVVTIQRSGQNINGGTSSLTLAAASATAPTWSHIVSDATNYTASLAGTGTSGAVSSVNTLTGAVTLFTVNAQTGTYQVLAADFAACKTIAVASGTFTITLVASGSQPPSGQCIDVINYGSGVVTISRSGQNLNGGTSSLTLSAGSATSPTWTHIVSDGTDYEASLAVVKAIASGALALATSAISANSCQAVSGGVNNATATGTLTTDRIIYTPNGSIKAVTVYTPAGTLTIVAYPTADNVNFDVCNKDQTNAVTPGAVTLNWMVLRP